ILEGAFDVWAVGDMSVALLMSVISPKKRDLIISSGVTSVIIGVDPDVYNSSSDRRMVKVRKLEEVAGFLLSLVPDVRIARFPEDQDPASLHGRAMEFIDGAKPYTGGPILR